MNLKSKPIFFLFTAIFLLFALNSYAVNFTASVDRNSLGPDETLSLTLSVQGQTSDEPDISELKNDFDILGKSSSRSVNMINGNYSVRTDWQIELAPKRSGKLLIPSFKMGKAVTDAIPIEVSQTAAPTPTDTSSPIQLVMEVSKHSAYVQEQIFIKVKLITQVGLSNLEPQPLQLNNARVVAYDTRQYRATNQGRAQLIVETDYAVFPQEVGDLIIPSLTYKVEQDRSRDFLSDPWSHSRNPVTRLVTKEQSIKILPPEQNVAMADWMPADDLKISENWSGNFDHLKVGDAITRTIQIESEGLTGAQIKPLNIPNQGGLTFYPDQARIDDEKLANGLRGKRIESLAIVANRPGRFQLPAIEVRWFNLKTHAFETAHLPEKTFEVEADTNSAANPTITQQKPNNPIESNVPINLNSTTKPGNELLWQAISGLLFLIVLALSIYIFKLKRSLKKSIQTELADTKIIEPNQQASWQSLKQAAEQQNASLLRSAIIRWADLQWPNDNIGSLDQVAEHINHADLTVALRALDASLYSNEKSVQWNGALILKHLNQARREKDQKEKTSTLKGLYPN